MQGFFLLIVIVCIVTFVGYKIDCWNDERKKSSNEVQNGKASNRVVQYPDRDISSAVNDIEEAYNIMTKYPLHFLKEKIYEKTIYFRNTDNEEFVFDPTYKVSIGCSCEYTSELFVQWMKDENVTKYCSSWSFRKNEWLGVGTEICTMTDTKNITWLTLKNEVIKNLKSTHPNWEIHDVGSYIYINV